MPHAKTKAFVLAIGETPKASLPEHGFDTTLGAAKYLHIERQGLDYAGTFEVDPLRRPGASGMDIYLPPGQLGLNYNDHAAVLASPATRWAYRRAQLNTPTGRLIFATLVSSVTAAWIDGSLAIGKGGALIVVSQETLDWLTGISTVCKGASAVFAFLLALWFKK
jgi:hypothetical protein